MITTINKNKWKLSLMLGAMAFASLAFADETPPEVPPVSTWHGANLLGMFNSAPKTPDNRVFDEFKECHFRWLRDWGFNFARLPMDYRYFMDPNDWSKLKLEGFAKVDRAVAWGRKYGIHVQLCLHRAPGFTCLGWDPEKTHLQTDVVSQDAFCRLWREFARRYRGISNRELSFNPVNEPSSFTEEQFIAVFDRVIKEIHAEDAGRFVMLDGNNTASIPVPYFYKVPLTGQAFRGYTPHAITHYKAWYIKTQPETEPTWPLSPELNSSKSWIYRSPEETVAKYEDAIKIGYPVMVGEFGCRNILKHETCLKWTEHCLKLWHQKGLGWAIWNIDGPVGFIDSERADVKYEDFDGHKLDRRMLELLQRYARMPNDQAFKLDRSVMSDKYWQIWNDDVQREMDSRIEKYRKSNAQVAINAPIGTEVKVEQLTHDFFFGAHIFNYGQLGTSERNRRYRELYGTLFNSATVAFYWKTLEPIPGAPRFKASYEDTEWFWNVCESPKTMPHWRRPPPDPVIDFLKTRRVRIHGHPLIWGNREWHYPSWIFDNFCPENEKRALENAAGCKFPTRGIDESAYSKMPKWSSAWSKACKALYKLSEEQIAALAPTYFRRMNELYEKRVREIGERYGERVDSWDVVNESADDYKLDFGLPVVTGKPMFKSRYGFMPADYPYQAFRWAMKYMPASAWLNLNDYNGSDDFVSQAKNLIAHGARIDVVGSQMHLFDPKSATTIAEGSYTETERDRALRGIGSYATICAKFDQLSKVNRPIHLSEITITAAGTNSDRDRMIQANITRNLYRAWFSQRLMNGITWWNVVDDCGAPGEPSYSGIFTRDMQPKPAYYVLNELINHEWKTRLSTKVEKTQDATGVVKFRGFKGRYRLSWKDANGNLQQKITEVK